MDYKICKKCNIEKEVSVFFSSYICKNCNQLRIKKWSQENKNHLKELHASEKYKEKRRAYYKKNKKYLAIKHKEYCSKPDKKLAIKEYYKNWKKSRLKTDVSFRLRNNISRTVNKSLNGFKKGRSTFKAIGYTPEELKIYLEKQFTNEMSWDNYGSYWHVDHIIPQSDLPFDSFEHPNFKLCWSLNNLRPLSAKQNILDGAYRTRHKKSKNG